MMPLKSNRCRSRLPASLTTLLATLLLWFALPMHAQAQAQALSIRCPKPATFKPVNGEGPYSSSDRFVSDGFSGWLNPGITRDQLRTMPDAGIMTAFVKTGTQVNIVCQYNLQGATTFRSAMTINALGATRAGTDIPITGTSLPVVLNPNQSAYAYGAGSSQTQVIGGDLAQWLRTGINLVCVGPNCMATVTGGDPAKDPYADYKTSGCAFPSVCLSVNAWGLPVTRADAVNSGKAVFTAQCSARFPDYIVEQQAFQRALADSNNATDARFVMAQNTPITLTSRGWDGDSWRAPEWSLGFSAPRGPPWLQYDFSDVMQADDYMLAVRDYIYGDNYKRTGVIDWGTTAGRSHWFAAPRMNYNPFPQEVTPVREFRQGMTRERSLPVGALMGNSAEVRNYAVSYYNFVGADTITRVWGIPQPGVDSPNSDLAQFPVHTVAFKTLYTLGPPEVFRDNPGALAGAPTTIISVDGQNRVAYLLQMDIAVRDPRATQSGWVFGTFAYQAPTTNGPALARPWDRMRPVGHMWGNAIATTLAPPRAPAPGQQGIRNGESMFSIKAPEYAQQTRVQNGTDQDSGYQGRMNGPVDNPRSSCMSCHSVAQYPRVAPLLFNNSCSDVEQAFWFRTLKGSEAFGYVVESTGQVGADGKPVQACQTSVTPPTSMAHMPALRPLDYSLQLDHTLTQAARFAPLLQNPCTLLGGQFATPQAAQEFLRPIAEQIRAAETRGPSAPASFSR